MLAWLKTILGKLIRKRPRPPLRSLCAAKAVIRDGPYEIRPFGSGWELVHKELGVGEVRLEVFRRIDLAMARLKELKS